MVSIDYERDEGHERRHAAFESWVWHNNLRDSVRPMFSVRWLFITGLAAAEVRWHPSVLCELIEHWIDASGVTGTLFFAVSVDCFGR